MDKRDLLLYRAKVLLRTFNVNFPFNYISCFKLAEQAEGFERMAVTMKAVAELPGSLSVEERNLLSIAYKNVVASGRASWRVLSSLEMKEINRGDDEKASLIGEYRQQVESEVASMSCLALCDA